MKYRITIQRIIDCEEQPFALKDLLDNELHDLTAMGRDGQVTISEIRADGFPCVSITETT